MPPGSTPEITPAVTPDSTTGPVKDEASQSVTFQWPGERLRLQVFDDRTIRVTATPNDAWSARPSMMVVNRPVKTEWSLIEGNEGWELSTAQMRVMIDPRGRLRFATAEGVTLLQDAFVDGREYEATDVMLGTVEETQAVHSVDGQRSKATAVRYHLDRQAFHTKLNFKFDPHEAIYGLGQHDQGYLNLRGTSQFLYQQNMKVAMPVLISTRGWGLLLDATSLVTFHDDGHGSYLWTDVADELDYYVVAGPGFDEIQAGLRRLTGKASMLPRWAWGFAQSKERYKTQQELIDIVAEYRRRHLPLDIIIQDWCTWPDGMWGEKQFDPTRFPEPRKLTDQLHQLNARLLVSIWPNMRDGPDTAAMRQQGFLLGNDSTYNAFDPKARDLYWQQAHDGYWQYGIDGWWCDCTEPFEADWKGTVKPQPWEQMRIDVEEFKKYLDPQFINAYSLLHSQGLYEHQRSVTPDRRMVNLTRSGFPGQQRYGTITWSGDVDATWETFRKQIPAGLSFCASGTPYWTHDIGGFFVKRGDKWFCHGQYSTGVDDLGYRELFVRWFQFGAFSPMFRAHGTDTPREVWHFGEPGEPFHDALVDMLHLRYRLLPYIYSLAGWVHHRDYIMMRLLAFDFPNDPEVFDLRDQYMFGPSLMVCPVTHPMHYGPDSTPLHGVAQSRPVYLPQGRDWYDFWTGTPHKGGQWIDAQAPLNQVPIFVPAGAILPLGPMIEHTGQQRDAAWEIRVYPGADGAFELYDDAGEGYDYERGDCAWQSLRWEDAKGQFTAEPWRGGFPGSMADRQLTIVQVKPGTGIGIGR